jgi:hypothetical protein
MHDLTLHAANGFVRPHGTATTAGSHVLCSDEKWVEAQLIDRCMVGPCHRTQTHKLCSNVKRSSTVGVGRFMVGPCLQQLLDNVDMPLHQAIGSVQREQEGQEACSA